MSELTRLIDKYDDERFALSEKIRGDQIRIDKLQDKILPELWACEKAAKALNGDSLYQCQITVTNYTDGKTHYLETDTLDEFTKTVELITEYTRELTNENNDSN